MSEIANRRWAAEMLGAADAANARTAFLRRVSAAGFVPLPEWRAAVRVLTGAPAAGPGGSAVDPGQFHDAARDGRDEVEAFATGFWHLEPDERHRQWQVLIDRCGSDPPLAARLRRLEAGLGVRAAPTGADGGRVGELAGFVQALFALRPADQAARRHEILSGLRTPLGAWRDAVVELREWYPDLAALDPTFLNAVRDTGRLVRLREQTRRIAHAVRANRGAGGRPTPVARPVESRPHGDLASSRGMAFGVIAATIVIVRLVVALNGPPEPKRAFVPPPIRVPPVILEKFGPRDQEDMIRRGFPDDDQDERLRKVREALARPDRAPPPQGAKP